LGRAHVLRGIEQAGASVEALASDRGGSRFALTYTLKFPKTGRYLTFPAYLGPPQNRVFGNYFTKVHHEYFDENYVFDAGKPYSFTVVFDAEQGQFDFLKEKASIDICDGKDKSWATGTVWRYSQWKGTSSPSIRSWRSSTCRGSRDTS